VQVKTEYQGSLCHQQNAANARKHALASLAKSRQKKVDVYYLDPKKCLKCNGPISYEKQLHGVFCTRSCAGFYNTKNRDCSHSPETKDAIQMALLERSVATGIRKSINDPITHQKKCMACDGDFETSRKKTMSCSSACHAVLILRTARKNRAKLSEMGKNNMAKLMASGKWKGWSGKGKDVSSYPERFIDGLLRQRSVSGYVFQYQVKRFCIDFAFVEQKIALEVDGKQHDYPGGREHDEKRDAILSALGWKVFRIKWKSIKTKNGAESVNSSFAEFMEFLKQNEYNKEPALVAELVDAADSKSVG
jgi:very-short-patch-repair endonuclease